MTNTDCSMAPHKAGLDEVIRCLWGFLCASFVPQHNAGPCAIGIHDCYTVDSVPVAIDPPDMVLYLDGEKDESATLRVQISTPGFRDLVVPEGKFDVSFDETGAQMKVLWSVSDEAGRFLLTECGTYTVTIFVDQDLHVVFRFVVKKGTVTS